MFLAIFVVMSIVMICMAMRRRTIQAHLDLDMDWTQTYLIPLLDSGQGQLTPSRETGKDGDKIELFMKPS